MAIETLAHDLAMVLDATDPRDAVLAGHSMGGMTIMSLATHRPDVLRERAKATVLVATAATSLGDRSAQSARVARAMVASPFVTRAMLAKNGHVFVRFALGDSPVRSHMDLTRELFGNCHGTVRGDFLGSPAAMDLLEGIATMEVPTTVMVGTRNALTLPKKAEQIVATVPGRDWSPCRTGGTCFRWKTPTRSPTRSCGPSRVSDSPGLHGSASQTRALISAAGARLVRERTRTPSPEG